MHHGFGFVPFFILLAAMLLIVGGLIAVFRGAVDPGPDRPDRARLRTRSWREREQTQTTKAVEQLARLALAPPQLRAATGPERGREIVNRGIDLGKAPRRNESEDDADHDVDNDRGNGPDIAAIQQALDLLVQAALRRQNALKALDRDEAPTPIQRVRSRRGPSG